VFVSRAIAPAARAAIVDAQVGASSKVLRQFLQTTQYAVLKGRAAMKRMLVSLTIGACLLLPSAGMTLAGQTGTKAPVTQQPGTNAGQNCTPTTASNVGAAAMAQGSPFNPSGTAGGVYANTFNGGGSSQNSNNLSATSQYDIACAQVP
jgi:hypothetical protein